MSGLDWRTITSSRSNEFGVKGTVLAASYFGRARRFMIEEVRALEPQDFADAWWTVTYRVRDGERVTDAEIREGKTSPVVFRSDDLNECLRYCLAEL